MDEGIFTLLFIGFMIFVSVMDAVGRKRKKQRRMETMEQEESESGSDREPWREASAESPAGTATAEHGSDWERETAEVPGESRRESAEAMIPEDFWAILTGQQSPDDSREGAGKRAESAADGDPGASRERKGDRPLPETDFRGRRSESAPPAEVQIPVPVPGDRVGTAGAPDATPTRRSARWMEGVEGARKGHALDDAIREEEALVYAGIEEPWGELEDITAGDLTTGDGPRRRRGGDAPPHRPGAYDQRGPAPPTSRYTRLLESGNVDDLRKAIVLREVLGRPVAFREDIGRSWME